jgi:hypothetical protein
MIITKQENYMFIILRLLVISTYHFLTREILLPFGDGVIQGDNINLNGVPTTQLDVS